MIINDDEFDWNNALCIYCNLVQTQLSLFLGLLVVC